MVDADDQSMFGFCQCQVGETAGGAPMWGLQVIGGRRLGTCFPSIPMKQVNGSNLQMVTIRSAKQG